MKIYHPAYSRTIFGHIQTATTLIDAGVFERLDAVAKTEIGFERSEEEHLGGVGGGDKEPPNIGLNINAM